jgi:hypothetical protein
MNWTELTILCVSLFLGGLKMGWFLSKMDSMQRENRKRWEQILNQMRQQHEQD